MRALLRQQRKVELELHPELAHMRRADQPAATETAPVDNVVSEAAAEPDIGNGSRSHGRRRPHEFVTGTVASAEQEWYFSCPCNVRGRNYDDGRQLVQCSRCDVWMHVDCLDKRRYDPMAADFYCPDCTYRTGGPPSRHQSQEADVGASADSELMIDDDVDITTLSPTGIKPIGFVSEDRKRKVSQGAGDMKPKQARSSPAKPPKPPREPKPPKEPKTPKEPKPPRAPKLPGDLQPELVQTGSSSSPVYFVPRMYQQLRPAGIGAPTAQEGSFLSAQSAAAFMSSSLSLPVPASYPVAGTGGQTSLAIRPLMPHGVSWPQPPPAMPTAIQDAKRLDRVSTIDEAARQPTAVKVELERPTTTEPSLIAARPTQIDLANELLLLAGGLERTSPQTAKAEVEPRPASSANKA